MPQQKSEVITGGIFVERVKFITVTWEFTLTHDFNTYGFIWVFPKIGIPQNGWLIMENPTEHG